MGDYLLKVFSLHSMLSHKYGYKENFSKKVFTNIGNHVIIYIVRGHTLLRERTSFHIFIPTTHFTGT